LAKAKTEAQRIRNKEDRQAALLGLEAYGKPPDGNNVTVAILDDSEFGAAATSISGSRVIVAFKEKQFGVNDLFIATAHEGIHVTAANSFLKCGGGSGCSPTAYNSERRAYTISSLMAQAINARDYSIGDGSGNQNEIWNSGWTQADKKVLESRNAAVEKLLGNLGIGPNDSAGKLPAFPGKIRKSM
jgi:hypothetical protein